MINNISIESIRKKIDTLDDQIMACIEQRAQYAMDIGQLKKQDRDNSEVYCPEREKEILQKKATLYNGLLDKNEIYQIFQHIIVACRNVQK